MIKASEELEAFVQRLEHTSKPTKATLIAWAVDLDRIKDQVVLLEEPPAENKRWQPGKWRRFPSRRGR